MWDGFESWGWHWFVRMRLHILALEYFSLVVFITTMEFCMVSLPGHLHLFHTDWGWLWSVLVSVVQFAFNTLRPGAKKQEVQKAQSHFSAIYVFSITHHLFSREETNSFSVFTDNPWVGRERPMPEWLPLSSFFEKGLTHCIFSS